MGAVLLPKTAESSSIMLIVVLLLGLSQSVVVVGARRALKSGADGGRRRPFFFFLPDAAFLSPIMSDVGLPPRQPQPRRGAFFFLPVPSSPRPSGGACRNLFGPVDHQELRRELEGHLRAMREEGRRRWEYDFQAGRPLGAPAAGPREGGGGERRFLWEEVDARDVPAFYRDKEEENTRQQQGEGEKESPKGGEGGQTPKTEEEEEEEEEEERLLATENHRGASAAPMSSYSGILLKGPLKRTASPGLPRITDFFAKRKRVADSRVAVDPSATALPASLAALPTEQTPRKRLR